MRDLILMEELFRARAYRPLDQVMFAAQAILQFGTPAQQAAYLPRIRGGQHIWCQLFSEPDAGSDLASLRTRAVPDGDAWVVTGQKVWSTDAQWADMGLLLARTDPTVDRHAGLTAFVVPMSTEGLEIRPIREMTGSEEFCEVFLDGVRLGPEYVLGEVHGGWRVISTGLASERAFVGANAVQLEMMFDDLVALAGACRLPDGSTLLDHEDVRVRLAELLTEVEGARLVVVDTVERMLRDDEHATDGAGGQARLDRDVRPVVRGGARAARHGGRRRRAGRRGRRALARGLLWSACPDDLRRRLRDPAGDHRPAAPRAPRA